MIGQSVAGILSSLSSIACQSLASNALVNGRLFFATAFTWTVLSVFLYELLIRSKGIESLLVEESNEIDQSSDQRLLGIFFFSKCFIYVKAYLKRNLGLYC